jgi:hypothetical protein
MTPNWLASPMGWRMPATVALAPDSMCAEHLLEVHAVHVVGADHHHDVGLLVVDEVQRLQDGVGRAENQRLPRRCCAGTEAT